MVKWVPYYRSQAVAGDGKKDVATARSMVLVTDNGAVIEYGVGPVSVSEKCAMCDDDADHASSTIRQCFKVWREWVDVGGWMYSTCLSSVYCSGSE